MDISEKARDEFIKTVCVEMMKERIRANPKASQGALAQVAVTDAVELWDALLDELLNDRDL